MTKAEIIALAERVDAQTGCNNRLDVQVALALFKPDSDFASARANFAGSKIVLMDHNGKKHVCWAEDHTWRKWSRDKASAALRAIAEGMEE